MPQVDVPRAAVGIFSFSSTGGVPPKAPIARVAELLGFKDVDHFRSTVAQWWPEWRGEATVSPAELVMLIHILQVKTAAARRLAQDLMDGGLCKVASLPSEAPPGLADEEQPSERPDEEPSPSPNKGDASKSRAEDDVARTESGREMKDPLPRSLAMRESPPWVACDPEDVGMDRDPFEKCRRYLSFRVSRRHFAGVVQGVVKNGKLVYYDEAGYADIANKTPIRQDTLMRLFSMTKCIVVVAFLAYAEDPALGIDLDDPVWKYIPSFKKAVVAPKRGSEKPRQIESRFYEEKTADGKGTRRVKLPTQPTLRQLLTHTAGLGYGPTLGDNIPATDKDHYKIYFDLCDRAAKGQFSSIEEWVDELAKVPLKVHPGSYWEYSFGTDVLGRVVEVISGKPLDQAIEEKVCAPLGMVDTCFKVPPEKAHRVGAWYQREPPLDENGKEYEKVPSGATWNLKVLDPSGVDCGWFGEKASRILSGGGTIEAPMAITGGMLSTFRDYLRFLVMIRNFGELDGVRVLRRETVQTMICNQIPAATGRRAAWVFDKKGQGYNFMGQIQVQHKEQEAFKENGEIRYGGNRYASLAPGTVSSEFGWGGLGGPAWTIDPRADLIVLSMSQTALELDHEENLRFSARRAIHSGIFGETSGPMKVTDYPPEFHEAKRTGKLQPKPVEQKRPPSVMAKPVTEAELQAFLEAEEEARARPKPLKEICISMGNVGHEEREEDDDAESVEGGIHAQRSVDVTVGAAPATAGPSASPPARREAGSGTRVLRQTPSASSNSSDKVGKRERRSIEFGGRKTEEEEAEPKAKQPRSAKKDKDDSPSRVAAVASPSKPASGVPLFARVSVRSDGDAAASKVSKARVTGVEGDELEVITEKGYQTMNVGMSDVSLIDETQFNLSGKDARGGPTDFSFLMQSPNAVDPKKAK